ncbi:MAG: cyclic nucleotide-binding domain-containing protein [Marmoricola sp.]
MSESEPVNIGHLSRFERLDQHDLVKVVNAGTYVRLPANWSLIWERTPADKAYLIVSGEVSVRRAGEEIARLGAGDVIGEMAIVAHKLRNASVVSLTPLEVIHFTADALDRIRAEVPAFDEALLATAAERLGDSGD